MRKLPTAETTRVRYIGEIPNELKGIENAEYWGNYYRDGEFTVNGEYKVEPRSFNDEYEGDGHYKTEFWIDSDDIGDNVPESIYLFEALD